MANRAELSALHAILLALMTYGFFSCADALVKWLQQSYGAPQILLITHGLAVLVIGSVAVWQRGWKAAFKSDYWKWHALRGLLIAGNLILILYAVKRVPLADFYGLVFLAPIWVALLSSLLMKEQIPLDRWLAILTGFAGVFVIAGPHFSDFNPGLAAAAGTGILLAFSALIARRIGKDEPITLFSFSVHAAIVILNAPFVLAGNFIMPDLQGLLLNLLYTVFIVIAMLGIAAIFARFSKPSLVAPMQYVQMIGGVVFGWMIFGDRPTAWVLAGSAMVIAAGIYIWRTRNAQALKGLRAGNGAPGSG